MEEMRKMSGTGPAGTRKPEVSRNLTKRQSATAVSSLRSHDLKSIARVISFCIPAQYFLRQACWRKVPRRLRLRRPRRLPPQLQRMKSMARPERQNFAAGSDRYGANTLTGKKYAAATNSEGKFGLSGIPRGDTCTRRVHGFALSHKSRAKS